MNSGGLGSRVLPSLPFASTSQIDTLQVAVQLLKGNIVDISHRIGQKEMDLGGEKFELLPQTVAWDRREFVSNSYYF